MAIFGLLLVIFGMVYDQHHGGGGGGGGEWFVTKFGDHKTVFF